MQAIVASIFVILLACSSSFAQDCGEAPNIADVDRRVEDIKGDLRGKAGAVFRRILEADLSGEIKATRDTFYQGSEAVIGAQKDNYFCYTLCTLVRSEKKLTFEAKRAALRECSSRPSKNTLNIKDATYASRWHPHKRGSIINHLRDQCENRSECQFACDNKRSGAGDVSKGDPTKRCIINYSCSMRPNDIIPIVVAEDERGVYPISCGN